MLRSLADLRRFLGYVWRGFPLSRVTLALSLVLLVLEYALLSVMIPLASVDASQSGRLVGFWRSIAATLSFPPTQMTWLWFFVVLTACSVLLGYIQLLLSTWLSKQVHSHLSARIFRRVLFDEPMIEIYRRSIGYYVTLAGDDTFRAGTIINNAAQTLTGLASSLAGFALLFFFSPRIFVAALLFLLVCGALIGLGFRNVLKANQASVELSRELGTSYIEALNGLRSIRSMSSEKFVHEGYVAGIRRYVRILFRIDAIRHGMKLVPALLLLVAGAIALWPRGSLSGALTVSYLLALTTIFIRLFLSLGATVNSASVLLLDVRAAKDIDALISETSSGPLRPLSTVPLARLSLANVDFAYPGGRGVLKGFSYLFEAGRTYAIVGRSGSGKSTLADVILGLIPPDGGEVLFNDQSTRDATLRERVVLVEQQARIFSVSVRENLLLGLQRSDDELWEALRAVDLEEYVRKLPKQLDEQLHYQGANFSGGQRQRLGIARALLRRPEVLILDEATSAIDADTRKILVANLRERMQKGALLFITHEQAIAEQADVVLEM